jgi:Putative metallopeptidase
VIPTRLSAFASDHGLPQGRFYNLICLAFGADRVGFADLANYLPSGRALGCRFEYQMLRRAFDKEVSPHVDPELAKRILDSVEKT